MPARTGQIDASEPIRRVYEAYGPRRMFWNSDFTRLRGTYADCLRLFRDEMSTTPARYVENIRFDLARALLDQGHTATQAAALAGFPSYESMRRVFARNLSISPAAYQRRFSTARRAGAD